MHTLARVCVERPVFATVLSLVLVVLGVAGYLNLGVDRFPDVDFPVVVVMTTYAGAGPEEVETEITDPIERQVNTIAGIDTLRSTSGDGLSMVMLQFELHKNVDVAAEEVRAKVALAKAALPPDADEPVVTKWDIGAVPVLTYAVSSNAPLREVYEYADKVLSRRIESVDGVGEVSLIGGRERQINVVLDLYRLRAYGVTADDVRGAIRDENLVIPGGVVERGDQQLLLRTKGRVTSIAEFAGLPVARYGDQVVTVGDVADIEDGEARATSLANVDGRETVVLSIVKQSGANAVAVIDAVKERLAEVELPAGYELVNVRDQSTYIEAALHAVVEHLVLGAVLAALVVLLFLRSPRSTIISGLAIPLSILATFAVMRALGFTQNMVTLLALTLSVGIVIDDAIVVLENIYRVLHQSSMSPREAAIAATKEIGLAVLAITLSLVAVFLPVAFMGGIVGRFLNSFGITMAAAIAVSLFVSFTLTPMLCSRWLVRAEGHAGEGDESEQGGWFGALDRGFTALLRWSMRHRWAIVIIATGLMFSMVPLGMVAKKNFLPEDDESQFQVLLRAPEGTSLAGTLAIAEPLAKQIRALPEMRLVMVTVGDDEDRSTNVATIFAAMNEVEDRRIADVTQFTLMERVRSEILPTIKRRDLRLSVQKASEFGGAQYDIELAVSGPDLAVLGRASDSLLATVRALPEVADADSTLITGKPELQVRVDRDRAANLGATVSDVAWALRLAVSGDDKISAFDEDGEQYEVHLRLRAEQRQDSEQLQLLEVPVSTGGFHGRTSLDQLVTFQQALGPAKVERIRRQRQFTLRVNLQPGASQGAVTAAIEQAIDQLGLPSEYKSTFVGASAEFAKMQRNFMFAFVLSFIFMFLVISAQFESFLHALVILSTLPLTVPFALLSIVLSGDSLNIFSMLGLLVLLGVVKKNAILQIDFANQMRATGMELIEAAVQAARVRLRPILMTTLAFVAGMLPLVLSSGTGAATNRSTGGVILFGQVLSLLVTLVAAPVFYVMAENLANRVWRGRRMPALSFRRYGRATRPLPEGGE